MKEKKDLLIKIINASIIIPPDLKEKQDIFKDFNFQDLINIAHAPIILPLLLENETLRKIIDTHEDFMGICFQRNLHLALPLLEDKRIKTMVLPFLKSAEEEFNKRNFRNHRPGTQIAFQKFILDYLLNSQNSTGEQKTKFINDPNKQAILKTFPTYRRYCDAMLYGPEIGYYSGGKVQFNSHFHTYASDSGTRPALAGAFAFQIYHAREKLLSAKKISPDATFLVYEGGAGTGDLCCSILTIIKAMAKTDKSWAKLYNTIEYHIVEKSPVLKLKQKETTRGFSGKVHIHAGDARELSKFFAKRSIAVSLSNELMDSIMPEVVGFTQEGLMIRQVVPLLSKASLINSKLDTAFKARLAINSKKLQQLLTDYVDKNSDIFSQQWVPLSEADYLTLYTRALREKMVFNLNFAPINIVDIQYDPEIHQYVRENPYICNQLHPEPVYLLQIGCREYLMNLREYLLDGGEVITVDYCYEPTNYCQRHDFRTYSLSRDEVGSSKIFARPGETDITFDIDIPNLAEIKGLQTLLYGRQAQMPLKAFPASVVPQEAKDLFMNSVSQPFVVLIQQKAVDEKTTKLKVDPERFEGKNLPYTRQQGKQWLQAQLAGLSDVPHQELYREASALCQNIPDSEAYLNEIKEKNYAGALINAVLSGSPQLVSILLKYKDWLAKDFDINEKSPSKEMSAYDLVEDSKAKPAIKATIKKMLLDAGATVKPKFQETLGR